MAECGEEDIGGKKGRKRMDDRGSEKQKRAGEGKERSKWVNVICVEEREREEGKELGETEIATRLRIRLRNRIN